MIHGEHVGTKGSDPFLIGLHMNFMVTSRLHKQVVLLLSPQINS